jgi:hypothetical protein
MDIATKKVPQKKCFPLWKVRRICMAITMKNRGKFGHMYSSVSYVFVVNVSVPWSLLYEFLSEIS